MNKYRRILIISLSFIFLLVVATIIVTEQQSKITIIYIKNYEAFSIDRFLNWEYYLGNATCTDFPYVADFDGDGLVDILFRAQGGQNKVYVGVINVSDGSLKWMTILNEPHPYSSTYLDYGNFYDDSPLEIVIGVSNHIYLISGLNGSILANFSLPSHGSSFSYIYAVDIDDDSLCEAVYQRDDKLYVVDFADNKLLWNISIECYRTLIAFYDIDHDGYKELFYTTPNGTIIGYKLGQGILWHVDARISGFNIYVPAIFIGVNNTISGLFIVNNSIICVNIFNGEIFWIRDLSNYFKKIVALSPALIDFNKDGVLEIFIVGFGGENEFITLNEFGEIEFTINVLDELIIPIFYSNIILDDIDSDNKYEIIGLSIDELYIVDLDDKVANLINFRFSLDPKERHVVIDHNGLAIIKVHGEKKIIITTLNHILVLNTANIPSS